MLPRIPVLIRLEFSFIHLVLLPPCSLSYVKVKVPRFYQVPKSRGNCSDHWSTARRHTPASMVLPSLTACSTGLFHGARTQRLTVPPLQVTHCLFLPSPPPGFAASQGADRNGGGSWLFFDPPPLCSRCEWDLSFSSLIDLKDSSLSPLPTGTPGLIFSVDLEFYKSGNAFDFGLCSLLCKNSWVNIMLKGLTIRLEKREAGARRSRNTFVPRNLPCRHLVGEEVWDEAEKQMRIVL